MLEVRLHGRGGQGAVTGAEVIAQAAIRKGLYAQAFPSFGPERRGAPVQAFLRISEGPIRIRTKIYEPDTIIILDPTLIGSVNPADGLKDGGFVIINTTKEADELKRLFPRARIAKVDASRIAREEIGIAITNITMIGAFLKAYGVLHPDDVDEVVKERFGVLAPKNIGAYRRAYRETVIID
jgi:pyruvate ferredoxin oxidoreductase gamma subunit